MENREQRPRRTFTPEFKAEVVELCRAGDRSIAQVARDLGLNQTTVRNWVNQAAVDAGVGDGVTSAERDEIARLRKEVGVLREDRDILKRATAFFAKETR